jgi:hypothetical protein
MKQKIMVGLLLLCAGTAFSQRLATVGIFPLEAAEGDFGLSDIENITGQVAAEIRSWGTMTVLEGGQAEKAEYLVRGQLVKTPGGLALTATTYEAGTEKSLCTAREEAASLAELRGRIFSFCAQVVESVPFPNFLLGRWRSSVDLGDTVVSCVVEFRTGRVVIIEQYDTYQDGGNATLKYQAYGRGTYVYSGHLRRTVAFKDARGVVYREAPVDGSMSIRFSLEDALPSYDAVNQNRLSLAFDEEKTQFELLNAGLSCGSAADGSPVAYTRFTKIP